MLVIVPTLLAIAANLCFVLSNVVFRRVELEASPKFINTYRTFIGSIFFIIYCGIFQLFPIIFSIPGKYWILLILSFIFGQVVGDTSYFTAQKSLGASKALAVAITFPIFTYIISIIFFNRYFDFLFLIGGIVTLGGIIVLQLSRRKSILASSTSDNHEMMLIKSKSSFWNRNAPLFYGLLASVGWAIGISLLDYSMTKLASDIEVGVHTAMLINAIRFPPIFLILLGLVCIEAPHNSVPRSKKTYGILLLGAIIGSTIGVYFFNQATFLGGATFVSILSTTNPILAIPLDYWINRERINLYGLLGILITIGGILILII